MAKQNVVTAVLAVAKWPNGSDWYGYQGVPVPGGLKDGELERLTDLGFVAEVDAPDDSEKAPAKKSASSK